MRRAIRSACAVHAVPGARFVRLSTKYLILCFAGVALPYSQFIPWAWSNGLDLPLFVSELFVNRISSFFAFDVIVSAMVLFVFIHAEDSRLGLKKLWAPVIGTLLVGVSFGLPLFLYMRATQITQRNEQTMS
jgi:Terpene cyclase DEP1